jgi:hypothetical protein
MIVCRKLAFFRLISADQVGSTVDAIGAFLADLAAEQ